MSLDETIGLVKKLTGSGSNKAKAIARPRSDEDVAKAVVDHSSAKAKVVKEKLDSKKKEIEDKAKQLDEISKKVRTLKRTEESLGDKYKRMVSKKRSELVDDYRKLITKLKLHPLVDEFDVDKEKRILVKTKLIKVKKPRWKKEKVAGVYSIRIDFSKDSYSQGIQILNLTNRHKNEYDSPIIQNTHPCWGNIGPDIEAEFNSQDLHELIIDLVDYISSPNDQEGYLTWSQSKDSDYKGGWEQFFSKLKKMPKNYSFEKYDQDNESERITATSGDGSVSPSTSATVSATAIPSSVADLPQNPLQRQVESVLGNFGLTNDAAAHFSRMIFIEGELFPSEIELRDERGGDIVLYVLRERSPRIDKLLLHPSDLSPEGRNRLMEARSLRYRFIRSTMSSYSSPVSDETPFDYQDLTPVSQITNWNYTTS